MIYFPINVSLKVILNNDNKYNLTLVSIFFLHTQIIVKLANDDNKQIIVLMHF